ncbi:hypothetical protein [Streptomyces acidicola]|uniref:Uncharacterized protein n=1 Tax=Streptomyces acidicola TaxID=2596892 RepID=A0A5N8WIA1_9ACTN|nr:hypothetical protein [Streptomyces acidicola]MPY47061.1 hypothetical protein [Streptomyces acidicola]MPY47200.1 hypothetical protein [Streptomyces acidicola]
MTAAAPAPESDAAQPSPTGPLSQLIQAALDDGKSLRELGKVAVDPETGEKISWQYFQKLVKNPPASAPSPVQMRAIAAALGKSETRIKEAVAEQWLDYRATELVGYGGTVRIILGHLGGMSEREQRRWLAMIEADERARREE